MLRCDPNGFDETEEARRVPATLTARAKQEGTSVLRPPSSD
jgi:hypothetical protein